jgi:hypothetical protein
MRSRIADVTEGRRAHPERPSRAVSFGVQADGPASGDMMRIPELVIAVSLDGAT